MLFRSAWIPAPPEGSEPAIASTRGIARPALGAGTPARPEGLAMEASSSAERAGACDGRNVDDKGDIPSPVLTGQVQRVWISAGSVLGTPCQGSSLAALAARKTATHKNS